jgi:hypothetical protein
MRGAYCLALAALALAAGTANGQTRFEFGVGGGISEPSGDFGNLAKTGWNGLGTVGIAPSSMPLAIQASGYFGENGFDAGSGKYQLAGVLGELRLILRTTGEIRPYVLFGGGAIDVKEAPDGFPSAHQTKGAIDGGIGLLFWAHKSTGLFVEARYVNVFTDVKKTEFIPVSVGLRFSPK